MRKIFRFIKSIGLNTKKLVMILPVFFAISFLTLAQPEVLRRATAAITGKSMDELMSVIILASVAAILFVSISLFNDIYLQRTRNYYEKELCSLLIHKLTHTKMSSLSKKEFGDVSTVLIRNTELFVRSVVDTITTGSSGYFALLLTFFYMCIVQWQLALCVLIYNLVIRFFAVFVERKMKKNASVANKAFKESGNTLSSLLKNMMTVRIYSNRDFFKNKIKSKEKAVMDTAWKKFVWSNGFQDFIWAFSKLAEFIIVYGVGAVLIAGGYSDMSILLSFIFANDLFTIGVTSLSYYIKSKSEYEAYRDSILEILEEEAMENEAEYNFSDDEMTVCFENVSFAYGETEILKNASFVIKAGEKVLIKGSNGQGKSTILKLICGLYRPQSGKIYFGNKNINDVNISSISKKCTYISQHSHLLEGNVKENISLSKGTNSVKVNMVLDQLRLNDSVDTAPQNLSMGEQQRLNIGRALYKEKSDILLCDEIFSNVDTANRQMVINSFAQNFESSTVIMISHEDIEYKFDRVLCVGDGKITEVAV